ncbi:MAG: tRNA pseudouridine synthase A [Luteibaculum sp.]
MVPLWAAAAKEIAVHAIQEVNLDFHARYDATQRTYEYWCHVGKNPFLKGLSMELFRELDLEAMNKAAAFLLGEKDFTSFAKLHGSAKHNYCQVFSAGWELNSGVYVFTISANRFLRNMVRATVGTLFQIGLGKEDPDHVNLVLQQKNRGAAGESVKACGLYLTDIKYPNLEWQRQ